MIEARRGRDLQELDAQHESPAGLRRRRLIFVRWVLRSWNSIARDLGTLRSVISVVQFEAPERR